MAGPSLLSVSASSLWLRTDTLGNDDHCKRHDPRMNPITTCVAKDWKIHFFGRCYREA